ncbi:flagellar protein FlbD [Candidatus Epulonipiscium fishelsonii]|uniref:Flagellar protein FlbD n=1 Tax=Candidatus Epulonipiscium fishelsonii TaxID=77094 RepID=A0ACC8XDT6_9FIRM|nr:flagellar protein FlbD [Epulopiscium sp. SCG-B05WGA-EpuloA1]ONI40987.1 flagellar protein FlbD [Epulopiscium sp. SCG-B11WGA-EpuloA1]ONI47339.1 flagellar protein FlbD [Epulopiscium sp. SCG-C06WGA-EpuloA1]
MIKLTRLNEKQFIMNSELIELMEETPDTVITLTNGRKYVVKEKVNEITDLIVEYKRRWFLRFTDEEKNMTNL